MGMIICEVHGQTGLTLVSPDIKKAYLSNQKPSEKYHPIKTIMFDNIFDFCWLSSEVVNQFNIPTDKLLSLEELAEYEELPLEPVCGKCFQDWISKK